MLGSIDYQCCWRMQRPRLTAVFATVIEPLELLAHGYNLLNDHPPIFLEVCLLLLQSLKQVGGVDEWPIIHGCLDLLLRCVHDQVDEEGRSSLTLSVHYPFWDFRRTVAINVVWFLVNDTDGALAMLGPREELTYSTGQYGGRVRPGSAVSSLGRLPLYGCVDCCTLSVRIQDDHEYQLAFLGCIFLIQTLAMVRHPTCWTALNASPNHFS